MASAGNSVSEPPNLKIFWGRIPPDPPKGLVPSALVRVPPLDKNPSYGPGFDGINHKYKHCVLISSVVLYEVSADKCTIICSLNLR